MNPWHNREISVKNFHVPLPDETYKRLKAAAAHSKMPATALGREAIDFWLRQRFRKARQDAIAAFAAEAAGTCLDLDNDLEAAAIEHLAKTGNALK
jgi:predicted transcriptional regulator